MSCRDRHLQRPRHDEQHCRTAITKEVAAVDAVEAVEVDLDRKLVTVRGPGFSDPAVRAAIDEAGYDVGGRSSAGLMRAPVRHLSAPARLAAFAARSRPHRRSRRARRRGDRERDGSPPQTQTAPG